MAHDEPLRPPTSDACSLGAFSVSLAVADLHASQEFYEKLGFEVFGGAVEHNYLILRNGTAVLGLFQGMFDANILTFNPGWDVSGAEVDPFIDVRRIEDALSEAGVDVLQGVADDAGATGPAHIMVVDPDGNQILIDQHR